MSNEEAKMSYASTKYSHRSRKMDIVQINDLHYTEVQDIQQSDAVKTTKN